ncbi:MAG: hypothetical protein LAT81_14780 [Oceanicaulis sp.]|nr:hypothetical protein [Oceanicaulis sp.]
MKEEIEKALEKVELKTQVVESFHYHGAKGCFTMYAAKGSHDWFGNPTDALVDGVMKALKPEIKKVLIEGQAKANGNN